MSLFLKFLVAAVAAGTPLLFGTVGEILNEKVGHLNLGVEGMMALGACAGFMTAYLTDSLALALLASFAAGVLASLIYAVLTVTFLANQNVAGLTLTIFGTGLSNFIGVYMISRSAEGTLKLPAKVTAALAAVHIPGLSDAPVVGELLFSYNVFVYLGVAVALPTLISRAVAAFLILRAAEHGAGPVQLHLRGLRLQGHMVRRILEIGVPSAVENGLFQLGRLLVVSIIATFGTAQIAANAVANNLDGMAILGGQALGLATITVVGQCVGAGDYAQARRYNRKLMLISWLLIAASVAAILASLPLLLNLYNISDEARVLSAQLVRLHNIPAIALWCLSFTLPNTLRAAGDARFTMVVSIVSMAVFRIGFSVVLGIWMGMGAIGVWIAMDIDWVCRVICFVARYFSGAWTRKYQNYQA